MSKGDRVIDGWKQLYVSGAWSLGEFEAHVEAMLPTIPPEWFLSDPPKRRSGARSAKQAAANWQASAATHAANYIAGVNSYAAPAALVEPPSL